MKPIALLLRLLLGLTFLCGGIWTLNQGEALHSLETQPQQWTIVQAEVTKRQVRETTANQLHKEKIPNNSDKRYRLQIAYKYEWNEKRLFGSLSSNSNSKSEDEANTLYPALQVGAPLSLKVNKLNPSQNFPQDIDRPSILVTYLTAGALILIGLFLTIRSLLKMRK